MNVFRSRIGVVGNDVGVRGGVDLGVSAGGSNLKLVSFLLPSILRIPYLLAANKDGNVERSLLLYSLDGVLELLAVDGAFDVVFLDQFVSSMRFSQILRTIAYVGLVVDLWHLEGSQRPRVPDGP